MVTLSVRKSISMLHSTLAICFQISVERKSKKAQRKGYFQNMSAGIMINLVGSVSVFPSLPLCICLASLWSFGVMKKIFKSLPGSKNSGINIVISQPHWIFMYQGPDMGYIFLLCNRKNLLIKNKKTHLTLMSYSYSTQYLNLTCGKYLNFTGQREKSVIKDRHKKTFQWLQPVVNSTLLSWIEL